MWAKACLIFLIFCALNVRAQNNTSANTTSQTQNATEAITKHEAVQQSNSSSNNTTVPKTPSVRTESDDKNVVMSPNYPKPYPNKMHDNWTVDAVDITVEFLDIDPELDFLKIHVGDSEDNLKNPGLILTGKLDSPIRMKTVNSSKVHIEFNANCQEGHTHTGFRISYSPKEEVIQPTTQSPKDATLSPIGFPTYSTYLSLPSAQQTNKTWNIMRSLLCNAADNFTTSHNLTLEKCHLNNVTFQSIVKCPEVWPNYMDCIEITFSIVLFENETGATTKDPFLEEPDELKIPTELSAVNLRKMWNECGKEAFKVHGFEEYKAVSTHGEILFWIGMGCSGVIFLVLVLIVISRLRMLRDYVKWRHNDEDNQKILKNQTDIDITMFPSPHQVVPTLFPSSVNAYSPSSSFLYGGDVYENRPREIAEGFNDIDPSLWSRGLRVNAMDNSILTLETEDNIRSQQETYLKGGKKDESTT